MKIFGEMIFLTHTEAEAKLNEINARYDHTTEKGGEEWWQLVDIAKTMKIVMQTKR